MVSQRPILADATAFRARFQTVFRESGRELQLRVRRGTSSGGHHFQLRGLKLKALPEAAPEAAPQPGKAQCPREARTLQGRVGRES